MWKGMSAEKPPKPNQIKPIKVDTLLFEEEKVTEPKTNAVLGVQRLDDRLKKNLKSDKHDENIKIKRAEFFTGAIKTIGKTHHQ